MFLYVTLGTNDVARAKTFYDPVLATLGMVSKPSSDDDIAYGHAEERAGLRERFFFVTTPYLNYAASWGNGTMVAFDAPSRAAVDAFHAAGIAHGGKDDGAPGLRPYHDSFYSCYLRDPDGNKISAVCEKPE